MDLEKLKYFLENETLLKQIKLDTQIPTNLKVNKPILKQILNKYNWLQNKSEIIYLLKHKNELENLHIFCSCKNKNGFINGKVGYHKHCSIKCSSNDPNVYNKIVKTKRNDIDKNGLDTFKRAGRKAVNTKRNDIDENGLDGNQRGSRKAIQTLRKRIGKGSNSEAIKAGFFKKHGVYWNSQTKEWKENFHNNINKIKEKEYKTKKKNGTLKSSNSEDIIYQALIYKFKFEDIFHLYKDKERYNFQCDFYIKSLDLFIEINFYPSHGGEPFDKDNIKHQEQLKNWAEKSKEINFKGKNKNKYLNFIHTWIIRDVEKFKIAKQNNLNYLAFYNWEQFFNWYLNI